MRAGTTAVLLLGAVVGASAPAAIAGEMVRHSGTIRSVDAAVGRVVLGEIGPWRVIGGRTQVTDITVGVGPDTHVVFARRDSGAPSGFAGDWVEEPADLARLRPGDFLTIDCVHAGARTTAHMLIVVRPDGR